MTQHSSHTSIQAHAEANLSEYRQPGKKTCLVQPDYLQGPSQAPDLRLGDKLLVDVNVYVEPIRRGRVLLCNSYEANMSTKVLSKSYNRTYHTCNIINRGQWSSQQKASFDSWLTYTTTLNRLQDITTYTSPLLTTTIHHRGSSSVILRKGHPRHSRLS